MRQRECPPKETLAHHSHWLWAIAFPAETQPRYKELDTMIPLECTQTTDESASTHGIRMVGMGMEMGIGMLMEKGMGMVMVIVQQFLQSCQRVG